MKCSDKIEKNKRLLSRLLELLEIDKNVDTLINDYNSIFSSYEKREKYERLRIIGTKPKNKKNDKEDKKSKNKNRKKDILLHIGKKDISKNNLDIELEKLNAELLCKIWQQTKQLIQIKKLDDTIYKIREDIKKRNSKLKLNLIFCAIIINNILLVCNKLCN